MRVHIGEKKLDLGCEMKAEHANVALKCLILDTNIDGFHGNEHI